MTAHRPSVTTPAPPWVAEALRHLDDEGLRRALRHLTSAAGPWVELDTPDGPRRVLHLCSNGYLGLSTHPEVVGAAVAAARRWGTGTGGSRLISGGQRPHRELEEALADLKGTADAVLFSSGYLANLGVITALVGRGDTVVSDAANHASIIDACRLSGAEIRVYRHGDPEHAAALLADAPGRRLLVTDGVFSMDGDVAPLPELCEVAERYGAMVVVDDAHGTGVVGPGGAGSVAAAGCTGRVTAIVGTLSKALGAAGGFVACSAELADWLRNRARSFIFDTAPPAPTVAAAHAAVTVLRREPARVDRVRELAARLADGLRAAGIPVPEPAAAIVPVVVGDNRAALAVMAELLARDVLAVAIRPPSVPPGTARIRATVMATHTAADIDHAVAAFRGAWEAVCVAG